MLILEETWMRDKISGISYHEHVTNVRVTKSEIFQKTWKADWNKTNVNRVGIIRESMQVKNTAFGSGLLLVTIGINYLAESRNLTLTLELFETPEPYQLVSCVDSALYPEVSVPFFFKIWFFYK